MRDTQPIPFYAVELLIQAKAMLDSHGTARQYSQYFRLQNAIIQFEAHMPLLPDGSINEAK